MSKRFICIYSGCCHQETYTLGRTAKSYPPLPNRAKSEGLEEIEVTTDDGDCELCRQKKLIDITRRIEEGKARLAKSSHENGYDYLKELRARMRAEGYYDY